ncbi:Formiminotransferase N-terminal subdomain-containing protein [Frankliniella fusca]|uniref:Formiminotransferase N-terminal subdomain-containing protein n=1 Tax=Frankliniella fusca TaxID=407009 RepID=A0AAE1HS15_9NEOP|nr:Formiminotransferase N-terminal subdomain-containing protein [Frankliniella fusca]
MADDEGEKLSRSQKRLRREYLRQAAASQPQVLGPDDSDNLTLEPEDFTMDLTLSVDSAIDPPPSTAILRTRQFSVQTSGVPQTSMAGPSQLSRQLTAAKDTPSEEHLQFCGMTVTAPETEIAAQLTENELPEPLKPDVTSPLDVNLSWISDNILVDSSHVVSFPIPNPDSDDISWVQWGIDNEEEPFTINNFEYEACREDYSDQEILLEPSTEDFVIKENCPIYEGSKISQWDSLTAILSFVQSENISGAEKIDEPVQMHYFCSICYKTRLSSTDLCDVCVDQSRAVQYFITVPLATQLKKMLKRPDFVADLEYKTSREKENVNNIEDILDGDVYKNAEKSTPFTLTAMWNTDGVQIFNSSSFSLWPFFLVINELPPDKRFLSENILIAGLWGSVTKPHPNVYLLPIYKDIQNLKKGIECDVHGVQERCIVKVIVVCGTCDAPARAVFINMKSHSGFFSCPVCRCKGERTNDVTVFPFEENVRLRSMEEYEQQVKWAVQNRVLHNKTRLNEEAACGIKGPSVLSYMVDDMFQSTSIDVMHCVYLGVTRQMLHLFIESDKEKPYSICTKLNLVSDKLLQISPPHFVQRLPQSLEKILLWKASELRSFLLYYALCVLFNVLNQKYYDHFILLVEGVALLNKSSVSDDDITLSSLLLSQFVKKFQELYGIRHMSHNLHMLSHLPLNVKNLGPLWATSCFKFEDMNGRLTNLVHGTRYAGLQIYSHLSVVTQLPLLICVHCIGNIRSLDANFNWVVEKLLENYNIVVQHTSIKLFHRLFKNNLLYVSNFYPAGKHVSSFIRYKVDNLFKYGVVQTFLKVRTCNCSDSCDCSAEYAAVIKPLELTPAFGNDIVKVHHIYTIIPSDLPEEIVYVDCLSTVLFKIDVGNSVYIAEPLNKYEFE